MKRLLAAYAIAAYAFLHVPLLILAVFSFNASKFTVWQGFSLALVSGRVRRSRPDRTRRSTA